MNIRNTNSHINQKSSLDIKNTISDKLKATNDLISLKDKLIKEATSKSDLRSLVENCPTNFMNGIKNQATLNKSSKDLVNFIVKDVNNRGKVVNKKENIPKPHWK